MADPKPAADAPAEPAADAPVEPAVEVDAEAPEPVEPSDGAKPAPKRAEVLRDFRKAFADKHQHGGGKRQKPAGGNPRFK